MHNLIFCWKSLFSNELTYEINFYAKLTWWYEANKIDILLHSNCKMELHWSCQCFGYIQKSLYNIKDSWNLLGHAVIQMLEWPVHSRAV